MECGACSRGDVNNLEKLKGTSISLMCLCMTRWPGSFTRLCDMHMEYIYLDYRAWRFLLPCGGTKVRQERPFYVENHYFVCLNKNIIRHNIANMLN
jgi:hypothetical protein